MNRRKKDQNVVNLILNRERGESRLTPYRASLNILNQLIQSKKNRYRCVWLKYSMSPIMYEAGHFYLNNNTTCYTLYGPNCKPGLSYFLRPKCAKGNILDAITYTVPVFKKTREELCEKDSALSRYLMCISKDNWLCQYNWENGAVMNEFYVKPFKEMLSFLHCDWNTYSSQIILTSGLNPKGSKKCKENIVAVLAVFNVSPLEFHTMFDIKRSVFGKNCKHVNVSDRMLILGMGQQGVHIYNFDDLLKNGSNFQPYKLGDKFGSEGKVGVYPLGLPYNISINTPPPILFNVKCYGQTIDFGGFPLHYIYLKKHEELIYKVKNLEKNCSTINGSFVSNELYDQGNSVAFHPDGSNRIMHRTANTVDCYRIAHNSETSELKQMYRMGFTELTEDEIDSFSSFGRKIKKRTFSREYVKFILATDYEDELELFGILGIPPDDPTETGFVKLYNNVGKEIRSIHLKYALCDTNRYDLHIDLDSVIIIERDLTRKFSVYLYQLRF